MQVVKTKAELHQALPNDRKVGFVPTMGALHDGHVSLVKASVDRDLFTVASIFINPTQFNDPKDFEKYPIDTKGDLDQLKAAGCDLVYMPHRDEVYPSDKNGSQYLHDFGHLETRFEGAYRPGHFKGVGQVVHILLESVQPEVAFFGKKDFQQLQVIHRLVKEANLEVEVVGMPTIREEDGLAMSSRNRRLSPEQRAESVLLYRALIISKNALGERPLDEVRSEVKEMFEGSEHMHLEYFDIIDPHTFLPKKDGDEGPFHAVIASYADDVRLIDNMRLD